MDRANLRTPSRLLAVAAACGLAVLDVPTIIRAQDLPSPPLEPQDEQVIQTDSAAAAQCLAMVQQFAAGNYPLETPLVTHSDKWGIVVRADFKFPDLDIKPLVNRMMCWKTPAGALNSGIFLGQNVPPLRASR